MCLLDVMVVIVNTTENYANTLIADSLSPFSR